MGGPIDEVRACFAGSALTYSSLRPILENVSAERAVSSFPLKSLTEENENVFRRAAIENVSPCTYKYSKDLMC